MFARVAPRRAAQTALGTGLAVLLTVVACSQSDGSPESAAGAAVDLRSDRASGDQPWHGVVPVYWTGSGDQSQRLFRESVQLSTSTTADPIESAVMAMTQAHPADADYGSLWSPITSLGTSFSRDVITLDLPSRAVSQNMDQDRAQLAIQQMIHTAVASAQQSGLVTGDTLPRVRILVDGEPGQEIFGSYQLPDKIVVDRAALAAVSLEPEALQVDSGTLSVTGRITDAVHDVELTVETVQAPEQSAESATPGQPGPSAHASDEAVQRVAVEQDYSQAHTAPSGMEITRTLDLQPGTYKISITATDAEGATLSDDFVVTVAQPS